MVNHKLHPLSTIRNEREKESEPEKGEREQSITRKRGKIRKNDGDFLP